MPCNIYDPASYHDAHKARRGLQPRLFALRRAQLSLTGAGRYALKWPVTKKTGRDSWVATFRYA
jgi:hypothetical protein